MTRRAIELSVASKHAKRIIECMAKYETRDNHHRVPGNVRVRRRINHYYDTKRSAKTVLGMLTKGVVDIVTWLEQNNADKEIVDAVRLAGQRWASKDEFDRHVLPSVKQNWLASRCPKTMTIHTPARTHVSPYHLARGIFCRATRHAVASVHPGGKRLVVWRYHDVPPSDNAPHHNSRVVLTFRKTGYYVERGQPSSGAMGGALVYTGPAPSTLLRHYRRSVMSDVGERLLSKEIAKLVVSFLC